MSQTANYNGSKTSLVYLERDGKYSILHRTKKAHDESGDKWIGVGGKFEPGETPDECALREVKEATGLAMADVALRGVPAAALRRRSDSLSGTIPLRRRFPAIASLPRMVHYAASVEAAGRRSLSASRRCWGRSAAARR